jgi:hypothetical protein
LEKASSGCWAEIASVKMRRGGRHGKGSAKSGGGDKKTPHSSSNGGASSKQAPITTASASKRAAMHDSGTISQFYSPFSSARPSVYDLDEMLRKIEQLHAPVGQASIHFELMLFLYLFLHTVLQNFNIYRTVLLPLSSSPIAAQSFHPLPFRGVHLLFIPRNPLCNDDLISPGSFSRPFSVTLAHSNTTRHHRHRHTHRISTTITSTCSS